MKKIVLYIVFLLASTNLFAQQELQMSNYLFDGIFMNPAYTGSKDFVRLSAMYRHQWTDMPGKPQTGMFAANIPFMFDNMGVGLQIITDHLGVTSMNEFYATYAYQLRFNKKLALGIGIKGGVSVYSARLNELRVWDGGDQEFENIAPTTVVPKFGVGLYLHGERFYVGFSIPSIWAYDEKYKENFSTNYNSMLLQQHFYLSGSYAFKLPKSLSLRPSVLMKYTMNAPFQADISLTLGWKDIVFLSFGYRTNAAVIGMLELRPIKWIRIAYAFDFSTPKYLSLYGGTSHEIMLGADLIRKNPKYKTPRYF